MTREEHFIKKTQLLAQIDSAEKLGCKNVLKHARAELTKQYPDKKQNKKGLLGLGFLGL